MTRITAVQWDDTPCDDLDQRVFIGNNGALIATVAQLYPLVGAVLDMTYGSGGFWTQIVPDDLVMIKNPPDWGDPIDFRHVPWPDSEFDHVIFDPPYVAKGGHATSTLDEMNDSYGMLTEGRNPGEQWQKVVLPGLSEAARLCRPKGLVWFKCMDYVTGGRVHWFTKLALAELAARGLVLEDEFILAGHPGPQPLERTRKCRKCCGDGHLQLFVAAGDGICDECGGTGRIASRQQHAARAHSVLMIARKR